jgi:transcriptional regulator with XRE-family HTH domain
MNMDLISGKRLLLAREVKPKRLKDLANEFKVSVSAIQKWQQRGVPLKFLCPVSHYFGVEVWVFTEEGLSDEDFRQIISNPTLQDQFRPEEKRKVPALIMPSERKFEEGNGHIPESKKFRISFNIDTKITIEGRLDVDLQQV